MAYIMDNILISPKISAHICYLFKKVQIRRILNSLQKCVDIHKAWTLHFQNPPIFESYTKMCSGQSSSSVRQLGISSCTFSWYCFNFYLFVAKVISQRLSHPCFHHIIFSRSSYTNRWWESLMQLMSSIKDLTL